MNHTIFLESLENSLEAFSLSKKTRAFSSPEVLSYDGEDDTITFEFLEDAITVRRLLRSYSYLNISKSFLIELFYNIGVSLAEYHHYSDKLHGDFQPNNVMFKLEDPRIVYVIDFTRSELSEGDLDYNRGSVYKDLALFAIHINIKYPYYLVPLLFRHFNDVFCQKMFKGYVDTSNMVFDNEKLKHELDRYRQKWFLNTFVYKFLGWSRFTNIKGNLG